jgi:hypothetical protein
MQPFTHAVLWENDQPGVDLNTLTSAGADLQLVVAYWINDRGEIVGLGHDPSCPFEDDCDAHAYVLIPCDENHPGLVGCDYNLVKTDTTVQDRSTQITLQSAPTSVVQLPQSEMTARLRSILGRRYRRFATSPRQY